jgi:hypothetical protein
MVYLINGQGQYFSIHDDVWQQCDEGILALKGCQLYNTLEELYEGVGLRALNMWGYKLAKDEVEGCEIIIHYNSNGELVETCRVTTEVELDTNLTDWVAEYEL